MKARKVFRRTLFLSIVIVLSAGGASGASQPSGLMTMQTTSSSPAQVSWHFETVESTSLVSVGQHVSLDLDPFTGLPSISHYDATNDTLRYAKYVGSGGTCAANDRWNCRLIDDGGDVGQYNSLAIEPIIHPSIYSWPKIAYYNATTGALEYAAYDWPGTWHYTTIEDISFGVSGQYTSLQLDSSKQAHIAYYSFSSLFTTGRLKYATYVGGGSGNCLDDDWQCDSIESGSTDHGKHASLQLDSGDNPSIAYYGENGDLKFATKGGLFANCGPGGNSWTCNIIDSIGDVGQYASLVRDDFGFPHIAYYDATNQALKYAKFVASGGNCGFFSGTYFWQCDEIDHMGSSTADMGISMAVDSQGYPVIAYQKTSDTEPAILKVARPTVAMGLLHGNCGPEDLFFTWQCETIDNGGSYTSVGNYIDIALNQSDLATIAYYESDSYNFSGNLKVAYQTIQTYLPLILK